MKYIFIFSISLIILGIVTACSEKEDVEADIFIPQIPEDDSLDVNGDEVADFLVSYTIYQTDDVPSSGATIFESLQPLYGNEILKHRELGCLFLVELDTIRKSSTDTIYWSGYTADILAINYRNEQWERYWQVQSRHEGPYMLGYKLNTANTTTIGWLMLEFDLENGQTLVTDNEYSSDEELVVDPHHLFSFFPS